MAKSSASSTTRLDSEGGKKKRRRVDPKTRAQVPTRGLALFIGNRTSEYSMAFTAATVSMLPMLILYIFGQKYFVAGQATSGIKG